MIAVQEYQRAIYALDACNVSGVIRDLARVLDDVWREVRSTSEGSTDDVAQHPLVVLYAHKIADLTRADNFDVFSKAYNIAKCQIRREVESVGA